VSRDRCPTSNSQCASFPNRHREHHGVGVTVTEDALQAAPFVVNIGLLFLGWLAGLIIARDAGDRWVTRGQAPPGFGRAAAVAEVRRALDIAQAVVIVLVPLLALAIDLYWGSRPGGWHTWVPLVTIAVVGTVLGTAVWMAEIERYGDQYKSSKQFLRRAFVTPTSWILSIGIIANVIAIPVAIHLA